MLQRKGERSRNKHWEINTQACNVNRCIWSARCIHPQKTTPQQGMVSYSSPKPSNLQKSEISTLRNGFSSSPYIIPPIKTRRGSLFINLTFPSLLPPPPSTHSHNLPPYKKKPPGWLFALHPLSSLALWLGYSSIWDGLLQHPHPIHPHSP